MVLDRIFLQVLNMSYTAGYVILFILLARLVLGKAPKRFTFALWSAALFRLICPWSFESMFSLLAIGGRATEQYRPFHEQHMTLETVRNSIAINRTGVVSPNISNMPAVSNMPPEPLLDNIFTLLWLTGIAVLLIYSVTMLFRLKKQLKNAVHDAGNVYLSEHLSTPFVMGVIRPKIYLPESLSETEKRYILLHEKTHIRQFDHVVKLVSFFVLCIHWFNPLVWLAFFLSGRDMEMACDEAVIRKLGNDVKKEYSASLLFFSIGRPIVGGSPLAFGEGDAKSRIKNILSYKKPAFWVMAISLITIIAICAGLALNPKPADEPSGYTDKLWQHRTAYLGDNAAVGGQEFADPLEAALTKAILEQEINAYSDSDFICESHITLATEAVDPAENGDRIETITVYAMVLIQRYNYTGDGLSEVGGNHIPTAITFDVDESGKYTLKEYWTPRDGSYYAPDIRAKFPSDIWQDALDTQKYILAQIQNCYAQAIEHKGLDTAPIIENLFKTIMSSPAASSNVGDYIDAHRLVYRELTYYGDYTLRYIFSEFLKGGQTGLKGQLMRAVMDDLIGDEKIPMTVDNGQEYFDAWREHGEQKLLSIGEDAMRDNYPKSYLMLTMLSGT